MTAQKKVESKANAKATESVETPVSVGQEQVVAAGKAGAEVFKNYEEVIALSKDNVEAVVKANTLFVNGVQDLNKQIFAMAQTTLEENAVITKKVLGCTCFQDAVAIQNDLIKANYEKAITESRMITDMTMKLYEGATAPITNQVNLAAEKFAKELAF